MWRPKQPKTNSNKKSDEDGGGMVRVEAENTKTDPGQPGQSLRKTKKIFCLKDSMRATSKQRLGKLYHRSPNSQRSCSAKAG